MKFDEKIAAGKSSDTQAFTPLLTGRYVVDAVDKAGRLLAAKPPPPLQPRPAPAKAKPTLHAGYYGGKYGVLADGNDAVEISVIYDGESTGQYGSSGTRKWTSQASRSWRPTKLTRGTGTMKLDNAKMTVSIPDLPESVVADYEAAARSRGIPLGDFLREYLIEHAPPTAIPRTERFARLRERIVASGVPLLDDDELRAEIRERRGMLADTDH